MCMCTCVGDITYNHINVGGRGLCVANLSKYRNKCVHLCHHNITRGFANLSKYRN